MRRWFRKHRGWSAVLAFGLLFLIAFFVYRALFSAGTSAEVQYVTEAVESGTLIVSVAGTGNAELGSAYDLTPSASGVVRDLNVKVGDAVAQGQVLFVLENQQLDMNVISAQASYEQSRASVFNAEVNLLQAEQAVEQVEDGGSSGSSSSAAASGGGPTAPGSGSAPTTTRTSTSVPPVTIPTTTTTAPTNTTGSSTTTTTVPGTTTTTAASTTTTVGSTTTTAASAARASTLLLVRNSTATSAAPVFAVLDSSASNEVTPVLVSSTESTDIDIAEKKLAAAEASLAAAQANLQIAQYNLEQAEADAAARTITAPTAGVVTELTVSEGASFGATSSGTTAGTTGGGQGATGAVASASGTSSSVALTIVDPDSVSAVVQLMESDIPQIEVGQKATLTFDALPDLTLTGKVTATDFAGTNNQGVVTFNVTVTPDTVDDRVRPGMTSYASIITAVRQDVLLVSSSAVKTATSGGSYVEVLVNGTPEQRNVTVGFAGDTQIEIESGLQAGDDVITQTVDPSATRTQTQSGGLGLGGGFPGAGGPGR